MLRGKQHATFLVFVLGCLVILQGLLFFFIIVRGESKLLELSVAALLALIGGTLYLLVGIIREGQARAVRLSRDNRDLATISRLSTKIYNSEMSRDELLDRFMRGITRGLGFPRAMLCLVDRKRVWLDVLRDTGLGDTLQFSGGSLLGTEPLITFIRRGTVEILDERATDASGSPPGDESPALYLVPLLNQSLDRTCWQITSCIRTDCPAYTAEKVSCWLVDGTLCGNPLKEASGDKLANCATCQVFPVIGVLLVASGVRKRDSHHRNVGVLRILAAEMAAALENHRLHEDNRRMVRELLERNRMTASALADLSLARALDIFTDSALKLSGVHACFFWLVSSDGRELVRKAGGTVDVGEGPDFCPDRLPVGEGLVGRALSQQGNFVLDYDIARHDATPLGRNAAAQGLSSLLAIALKSEGDPVGVFSVHKRGTTPFLDTEIAAFMLLANQAAMSINVCLMSEELKNQNRELGRQTSLLGGILSSMSSGVMLLDRSGAVSLVNEAGAEILRSSREDLIGRNLAGIHPETAAFLQPGAGRNIDLRLRDGTAVPVGFSSTHYRGDEGDREGVIVVFRDLSEIRALQAEVLNKERFAAMGRVVAGAAHEIRNPLFGISSVGQILERELESPQHRELVKALLSETKRMNQLVEELLLYGRPMKLTLGPCDLAKIRQEVLDMHRGELDRRGIRIGGDALFVPLTVNLDSDQIRQVFLNLLRNAIDATRPGGEISIRLLLEDRYVVVKIADTGVGIRPQQLDKIFDLFFTTKPKGTGLGLAICKKIVQDHGGEIAVESEEGKGTAVTVRLPYQGTTAA